MDNENKDNDVTYYVSDRENISAADDTPHEGSISNDGVFTDDASGFVSLSEYLPEAILEIRYATTYNFTGDVIDGYEQPLALLSKEAAKALKAVSEDLAKRGYRLKIYDAYRPQRAVNSFIIWAADIRDTRMKDYFYPQLDKSVLFDQGYIAEKSSHTRGSTVDLTLFDMNTGKELDMGGTFDLFSEISHSDYTDLSEEQLANRKLLKQAMEAHGFAGITEEWWHFTLKDEPYPDTYFDFPVSYESFK
ncbi:MAG: M15 family metallopeptidase [Erysipelotrichaceae bacterium]|nr:M15 family metallopeptidase [Erysipelotrichaceae bacterium]